MHEENSVIGPLMKAARKFKKLNQSDVAKAIGCSQSALSKMEHNLLIPNAPQWFLFSRFTNIPPETIETGVIDRHSKARLNDDSVSLGYKLPKRYRLNRAQKIREVYPFLFYLEKKIGQEALTQFTESVDIESEFFLDYDNLINFQVIVDLINFYDRLGKNRPEDIKSVVEFGQNDLYWDKFDEPWKNLTDSSLILGEYSKQQGYFQSDFHISSVLENNRLVVAYTPEPHLYHFLKDLTDETKLWLQYYRKYTLENLVRRVQGVEIEARPVSSLTNSPLENRFEIYS
jgi:transcriptional regulator with XRE-family HTH domain